MVLKIYPQLQHAADAIEQEIGISIEEIRSDKRRHEYCVARLLICALCYDVPTLAVSEFINRKLSDVSYYRKTSLKKTSSDGILFGIYNRVLVRFNKIKDVQ